MRVFGGTSNPNLTQEVCNYLGIEPGKITAKTFSDGETQIEIHENIRMMDVFVLQSTCSPVNDNISLSFWTPLGGHLPKRLRRSSLITGMGGKTER
jgi:phosphoribosylpyrophosphate synthetase